MGYIGFIIFIKIGSDPIAIGYAETLTMSAKERDKLKIIQLIDTGNVTYTEAAELMGISERHLYCIVHDFIDALSPEEKIFLDDVLAGFKLYEISKRNCIPYSYISSIRQAVMDKAVEYL